MSEENKQATSSAEEKGVSLREIFKVIGKKLWYVVGGSLLTTLVAVILFMFVINPFIQSNSMSFQVTYPRASTGKYPDGSVFDYQDIVSRKVLDAVKNNPEYEGAFSSIDPQKIIKNDGISITVKSSSDGNVYTVSLKETYFRGIDTQDFIEALTDTFLSSVMVNGKITKNLDFQLDTAIFEQATFKDQVVLLSEQKATIVSQYNTWIGEYSSGRIVAGKPLSSYRAESVTMFADNIKTSIENTLTLNGYEYFNKSVTGEEVQARVEQLQGELKLDLAVLEELKKYYTESSQTPGGERDARRAAKNTATYAGQTEEGSGTTGGDIVIMPGDSDLSQKIAYYSERAAILKQQIIRLTNLDDADESTDISKISFDKTAAEIKAFGEKYLDGQLKDMNSKAETLKKVITEIYTTDTTVLFESQKVESSGDISLIIVVVGVFVVSFLVFAAVVYTKGKKAKNKNANAEPQADSSGTAE